MSSKNKFSKKLAWLSEIKLGLLKHSVPISTSTPKEKGVDANFEVLFTSPPILKVIGAPKPHLGASINGSKNDTDQVYSGLTWSWLPFKNIFVDASLGLSIHNGVRDVETKPGYTDPLDGRVREFGCDWLFRESIEAGIVLQDIHRISLMWDHISHGGICGGENEGMDNLGLRYGYLF